MVFVAIYCSGKGPELEAFMEDNGVQIVVDNDRIFFTWPDDFGLPSTDPPNPPESLINKIIAPLFRKYEVLSVGWGESNKMAIDGLIFAESHGRALVRYSYMGFDILVPD